MIAKVKARTELGGPALDCVRRSGAWRKSLGDYSEIRVGWRLLLAALLGTGLGLPPLPFYSIGIFAPILAQTFGWSLASILGGLALIPVVLLVGGPWVGRLVDRQGARNIAALSLAGLGISYMSLALSSGSLLQYYVSWLAMAVSGLGATPISFTRAVSGAFVVRRGLALGITLAGIGLFASIVKPLAAWVLSTGNWRVAIVAIGMLPILIGVPAVLWAVPRKPAVERDTLRDAFPSAKPMMGVAIAEALGTRTFWILLLAMTAISFANTAPLPNLENLLKSVHLGARDVVALTSLTGITIVAGRLMGGWLMDRVWAPLVGCTVLGGAALACGILSQPAVSYAQAQVAIVLLGFAAGAEFDLLSYLVGRYFGVRHYGAIYGVLFGVFAVGGGCGPGLLSYAYDRSGGYSFGMRVCAASMLMAACLLLTLGRYPDKT
jgi:MFS family permease